MLRLVMFGREETGLHFCRTKWKTRWSFMSCQSLKMTTCSLRTESVKQGDAFGPNSIQCSLQVHVQEVSPWNRINRWVSEATTQLIEAKKQIFWAMWEVFASVLSELINMGSPALLELPRGCDYWKDRRMTDLVEGTVSHEHKFDGCMYGLKSQFQETPKPIKKPWKIVTWGVSFPKLHRRCDRRHDHVECAGRGKLALHKCIPSG